jgi:hypothetical protein
MMKAAADCPSVWVQKEYSSEVRIEPTVRSEFRYEKEDIKIFYNDASMIFEKFVPDERFTDRGRSGHWLEDQVLMKMNQESEFERHLEIEHPKDSAVMQHECSEEKEERGGRGGETAEEDVFQTTSCLSHETFGARFKSGVWGRGFASNTRSVPPGGGRTRGGGGVPSLASLAEQAIRDHWAREASR